jgi:broad specificity phosphatase PhoE
MKLYLIRHGQSETNLKGLFTGQAQVRLTEQGERDALRAGELLRGISFDKVYASDLVRAMRTAELALPGVAYETTPLLREYDLGELVLQSVADCRVKYAPDFDENRSKGDYTPYGGENARMVGARFLTFLDGIRDKGYDRVAVFAHGGLIGVVFDVLLGAQGRISKRVDNGSISVFSIEKDRTSLLLWNYTGCLPDAPDDGVGKPI